jgi:hypothetical protein
MSETATQQAKRAQQTTGAPQATGIPVHNHPARVSLTGHRPGAYVLVKRLGRQSVQAKVMRAAGLSESPGVGDWLAYKLLLLRAAVVGSEGLVHCDTGEDVAYAAEHHPVLGVIATELIADCLSVADAERALHAANGPIASPDAVELTEAQVGNS